MKKPAETTPPAQTETTSTVWPAVNTAAAWRHLLPELAGLPLLPMGPDDTGGSPGKVPADPRTGRNLPGWTTAAFTPEEVAGACSKISGVGFRPGPDAGGLIAFDVDGPTAVALLRENDCDPLTAPTWQVRRDNNADRLKVIWRIPEDTRDHLPTGTPKLITKPPSAQGAKDGENVAYYYGAGQVVALGQHLESGGNYFWPDGHGPGDVAEIPPNWWRMAWEVSERGASKGKGKASSTPGTVKGGWRRLRHCPICGRDERPICAQSQDGRFLACYHGGTFSPPEMRPGQVMTGSDGVRWAHTGIRAHGDIGDFSHFKVDEPREEPDHTAGFPDHPDDNDHQGRGEQQEAMPLAKSRKPPARLSPHDVKRLLPERLGAIRSNIRTGEIVTEKGTRSGNDLGRLYVLLCDERETWPKDATADAVAVIAAANTYDPVEQYLQGIATPPLPMEQWQRLDQHLLGIDHPIAAAFLPRYLISAVARTMEPGCDVRQMLVLIGPQWRGKTALGRILFGAAYWVEGVGNMDRDALQKAHTAWGVELAELDGVSRRSDPEKLKAFLTEPVDTIQLKYDRHPGRHPRRFVFWGTANSPPLNDPTGSTRFVCIEIPDRMLPLDWAVEHRDAIWARALEQHRSGVQWTAITEEERQAIEAMNTDFQQQDPWAEAITEHLADAEKHERLPVKIPDLLRKMDVTTDRQTKALAARVRAIAERLGWKHRRGRRNGSDPLAGLWPPEPSTVHGVHPPCTLTPARPDASQGSRSGVAVHPVHPSFYEKEKTGKRGEATSPQAPAAHNAEGLPPRRVHGVHGPQTDGAAVDQPVHPTRAPITGKPPTFNVNPWAGTDARPPRSDADRLHDRQAQQRSQRESELMEQQLWDQSA
jgi:hypothetical protein